MQMTMNEQSMMIDAVMREQSDLDDWQDGFMKSVVGMRDRGVCLTAKQQDALTKIYDDVVDRS